MYLLYIKVGYGEWLNGRISIYFFLFLLLKAIKSCFLYINDWDIVVLNESTNIIKV